MSNAEKMVMVPRELLERYVSSVEDHNYGFDGDAEIRALLDAPAQPHQGEPVALPERMECHSHLAQQRDWKWCEGWNACLDEIAKLGPLYTHADPAEVERLQRRIQNAELALKAQTKNCDTLRAQLAEAHALLRHLYDHNELSMGDDQLILAYLSASAEPSEPVEIDERAERAKFEAWHAANFHNGAPVRGRWLAWQARAALERKS